MPDRKAVIERNTNETKIRVEINLDGTGKSEIHTGVGFFDHMLTHLSKHSLCDLSVTCKGDLEIDAHHSVEDVGICIGKALAEAVGDKAGMTRYGSFILPMDEALIMASIDISGRGSLYYEINTDKEMIGTFDTDLAEEFLKSLCNNAGINAHIRQLAGTNAHHIIEGTFKAFAKALRQAVSMDPRVQGVPSTKGSL